MDYLDVKRGKHFVLCALRALILCFCFLSLHLDKVSRSNDTKYLAFDRSLERVNVKKLTHISLNQSLWFFSNPTKVILLIILFVVNTSTIE